MPNKVCETCFFWSEMLAQSVGNGVQAVCLAPDGPRHGEYTGRRDSCPSHQFPPRDNLGAYDSPARMSAAYD